MARVAYLTIVMSLFLGACLLKLLVLIREGELSTFQSLTLAFDVLFLTSILCLHVRRPQLTLLSCFAVFTSMGIYHWFNLGKHCGCFADSSVSSWQMVGGMMSLGIVGLVLYIQAAQDGRPIPRTAGTGIVFLLMFMAVSFFVFAEVRDYQQRKSLIDLCGLKGESPIREIKNIDLGNLENGTMWILLADCEKCERLARRLVDGYQLEEFLKTKVKHYMVFERDSSFVLSYVVLTRNNLGVEGEILPIKLNIENGTVIDCESLSF